MRWFRRRKKVRSEKLALHRRKIFMWKVGIALTLSLVLIALSSWVLHRPQLQINHIVVNGNSVVRDDEIRGVTEDVLRGKYFFLFPRTNSLLYPEKEIEASVLAAFKKIESIDLVWIDFHTLSIEVEEQKPYALWCTEKIKGKPDDVRDCYFLNTEGFIFSRAPNFTGNVFLRFYGDIDKSIDNNIEKGDPIGTYYLKTNNEFMRTNVLVDSIAVLGMKPVEIRLLGEVDIELYMEDGSKILFAREQRRGNILDNLQVVLESETFKNQNEKEIEYIDLRFGNKVYFKLK